MGRRRGLGYRRTALYRGISPECDTLVAGLCDLYDLTVPGGAFYLFPRLPWGSGMEFVARGIEEHQLLVIPGNVFSRRDTHFRISYAASDETIARGIEALRKLAKGTPGFSA